MFTPIAHFLPLISSAQKKTQKTTSRAHFFLPLVEDKKLVGSPANSASQAPTRCSTPDGFEQFEKEFESKAVDELVYEKVDKNKKKVDEEKDRLDSNASCSHAGCSDASEPQVYDEQARILEQLLEKAIDLTHDSDSDRGAGRWVNLIEGDTYSMTAACPQAKVQAK